MVKVLSSTVHGTASQRGLTPATQENQWGNRFLVFLRRISEVVEQADDSIMISRSGVLGNGFSFRMCRQKNTHRQVSDFTVQPYYSIACNRVKNPTGKV
jgi:hypothetical protein